VAKEKTIMMGGLSIWHWVIIAVAAAVVFGGRGKLSALMGDAAQGIKAFKNGMKDEPEPAPVPVRVETVDKTVT
jgi:sec-independent protein translocase protein TatA